MESLESIKNEAAGKGTSPETAQPRDVKTDKKGVKNGNAKAVLISFVLAFICITIVSSCSFLYEFNDWPDVNWYLTVGHGLADGLVPYKDLFEQKGVFLYFIFALNYLIFGNAFYGIYILEILCATAFLFVSFKILRLYLGYNASCALLVAVALLAYTPAKLQIGGGSVEEYCLPLLAFGLYVFLSYIKRGGDKIPLWQAALCGLFSGLIFWIKYAALLFYALFAVIVFVDRCIKRDVKSGFIYAAVFLAAFVVPAIPCLIYLGVNDAVGDMLRVYIYLNVFSYGGGSFAGRLTDTLLNLLYFSYFYIIAAVGVIYIFRRTKIQFRFKIYTAVLLGAMAVLQLVYSKYLQYQYPIVIFIPFGIYPALFYIKTLFGYLRRRLRAKNGAEGTAVTENTSVCRLSKTGINVRTCTVTAIFVILFYFICGNSTIAIFTGNDYAQLQVAQTITEHSGGNDYSLLTYMIGDEGFYTACDVSPKHYYFAANAFSEEDYPEIYSEVRGYISDRKTDYVITETRYYQAEKDLFDTGGYLVIGEYSYTRIMGNFRRKPMEYTLLAKS